MRLARRKPSSFGALRMETNDTETNYRSDRRCDIPKRALTMPDLTTFSKINLWE